MAGRNVTPSERGPEERMADHAMIDRLAAELLPALVERLGASGLGELEVREGAWRLRQQMPAEAAARARAIATAAAADPDLLQLTLPDPEAPTTATATDAASTAAASGPDAVAPAPAEFHAQDREAATPRVVARSPAVGFFRPRPGLAEGATLRKGATIGSIDVLGIAQEVSAPAAGTLFAFLVQPGEPVEFGQEILEIGLPPAAGQPGTAAVAGAAGAYPATSTVATPGAAPVSPEASA